MIVGAGRGIGLAIAKKMAKQGSALILTELPDRMEQLQENAQELAKDYQVSVQTLSLDIRNLENIKEVFLDLAQKEITLNYLVCNAGVNYLRKAIEVTEDIWDEVNDVNVKGNFFVMQEAAKQMIMGEGGSIVAIASQHGEKPNYDRAPYCASKAALIHLCKELALEWAAYKIRVNTVSPSFVLYESNKELLLSARGKREYLNTIPLHEYCSEDDVAGAVTYLLSEEARMITGHNLLVDGGWMLK